MADPKNDEPEEQEEIFTLKSWGGKTYDIDNEEDL